MAVMVLDQVQVLDQQVAAAWPVCQQALDFLKGLSIDLAALWGPSRAPPAASRNVASRGHFLRSHIHSFLRAP
jgi:hypothetical protein